MIAVSVFDMIKGIQARTLYNGDGVRPDLGAQLEPSFHVDRGVLELRRPEDRIIVCGRIGFGKTACFWANMLQGTPDPMLKRPGDYCGVGLWMRNPAPRGVELHETLSLVLESLGRLMRTSTRARWDMFGLKIGDFALSSATMRFLDADHGDRPFAKLRAVEAREDFCCLDVSDDGGPSAPGDWIDYAFQDPMFDNFERVIICSDPALAKDIRSKGQAPLLRPDPRNSNYRRQTPAPKDEAFRAPVPARRVELPRSDFSSRPQAEEDDVNLRSDIDGLRAELSSLKQDAIKTQTRLSRRVRYLEVATSGAVVLLMVPLAWMILSNWVGPPAGPGLKATVLPEASSGPDNPHIIDSRQSLEPPHVEAKAASTGPEKPLSTEAFATSARVKREGESGRAVPQAMTASDIEQFTKELVRNSDIMLKMNRSAMTPEQARFYDAMLAAGKHWLSDGKGEGLN